MRTEELGQSTILNLLLKPAGWAMESPLRRFLHDPVMILNGAGIQAGETVLEVGSGTGFFTIPAARLIGDKGRLIAMEPLAGFAARLVEKVHAEDLRNVEVVRRDALNTRLEPQSIDRVLLFGAVPTPSLPLQQLLPEMHRVLKRHGTMAVWQFPFAAWVPRTIDRSGLFAESVMRNGVYNYRRHELADEN